MFAKRPGWVWKMTLSWRTQRPAWYWYHSKLYCCQIFWSSLIQTCTFINPQSVWKRWSGLGLSSPPLGWTWASQQPLSTSSTRSFSRFSIAYPAFPILAVQVIILIYWLRFSFFKDSKTFQKEQEPPSPPEPPKPPVTMTSFIYLMYVCGIVQF